MIEPDEVDEDYFTPIASTKLANIFGSTSHDETENETLKYTPPKPPNLSKPPVAKLTECLIACALFAYEWNENTYLEKGKIGFAIIKYLKTNGHDLVLYDSNKTTLSKTTLTLTSEFTLQNKQFICFYDNTRKFWCIYGTEKEITPVIEVLKKLNAIVKYSETDKALMKPPGPDVTDNNECLQHLEQLKQEDLSDTDSSFQAKTKDAILTRMANMGQSVLPQHVISLEKASDSSDTNEAVSYTKTVRHKPFKSNLKRINVKNNLPEGQTDSDHKLTSVGDLAVSKEQFYTLVNGKFLPIVSSSDVLSNPLVNIDNDLKLLMTEQRVGNSELRINIGRINDKVDEIMHCLKATQNTKTNEADGSFRLEIVQKLLSEYEKKIKDYEKIIESNEMERSLNSSKQANEIEFYKTKILQLEETIREKDKKIIALTEKLNTISKNTNEM